MYLKNANTQIRIWLFTIVLCMLDDAFLENSCLGHVSAEFPKACTHLKCKRGEQCVSRKFWCKFPPCPNMLYCSKSRKESLKGPSTCENVRCSKRFVCLVRARLCRWDEECEQQIARCVSERDFFEGPASCVDFRCPSGHRCILRESLCAKPPCKLLKSCAEMKEVRVWLQKCRNIGCLSEHECFLRRPQLNCTGSSCKHSPDCSASSEEELEEREQCRGWACPKGEECTAHSKGVCNRESCRISRSCQKPLMSPVNSAPSPPHAWRDDIKLSFYTKQEESSPGSGMKNFPSRTNDDKKSSIYLEGRNVNPSNDAQMHKLSSSRPSAHWGNVTSGQAAKPTVTSLTTWLNYLKSMTGVDAVESWIEKSDREENYQQFLEWLESVKDMLGSAAYELWLEEVRAMTVTNLAFQKWLPPSPTERSTNANHLVRQDGNFGEPSHRGREIFPGSQSSNKYRNDQYLNSLQLQNDHGTTSLVNDDIQNSKDLYLPRNEIATFDVTRNNENSRLTTYPLTPPSTLTNNRSPLYPTVSVPLQQNGPFRPNFENIPSWHSEINQAFPYHDYDNTASLDPPYPPFPSNWSFPQAPDENPLYIDPKTWQEQLFPPAYPQWHEEGNERDAISPDQRILRYPLDSGSMYPPFMGDAMKFYSQNSSYSEEPWIRSFNQRYGTSQFSNPENFESYEITEKNLNYPDWPEASIPFMPQQRSKPQDPEAPESFPYEPADVASLGENFSNPRENSFPYYPRYPWEFKELRKRDNYLRFLDYTRRNLYDKNNQARSPALSPLSRPHRVDFDPFLSPRDPYIPGNKVNAPRPPPYHWSSYPRQLLHGISRTRSRISDPRSIPEVWQNEGREAVSAKRSLADKDQLPRAFLLDDRFHDVPGQAMELPDLWNSRYRHPFSWFLRKNVKEEFDDRDTIPRVHAVTTNSPSSVASSKKMTKPRISQVTRKNTREENLNDYEDFAKSSDYSDENDDGIFPLLLNLQGYIESPPRQTLPETSNPPKSLTILPVYTIDNGPSDDNGNKHEATAEENEARNFYRDENTRSDFSGRLESAFRAEAASIMRNRTGDGDVKVNDVKWEYEYDEEDEDDDPKSWHDAQLDISMNDGSSNEEPVNGWVVKRRGAWDDERSESDYHEVRGDYDEDVVPDDGSSFGPDSINIEAPSRREKILDLFNDHLLHDDQEHKTFKKNQPL